MNLLVDVEIYNRWKELGNINIRDQDQNVQNREEENEEDDISREEAKSIIG